MAKTANQIQAIIKAKRKRVANLEKELKIVKGEILRLNSQMKTAKK